MLKASKILFSLSILLLTCCINSDKREHSLVIDIINNQYPMYVSLSPDGNKILSKSRNGVLFDLLISDKSNSRLDTVDTSSFTQLSLTWHPHGNEIVFQEFNTRTRMFDLYKINLETKVKSLIGLPSSTNAIPPLRWSPNGNYLAYMASNENPELHIFDYKNNIIVRTILNIDIYADFQWYDNDKIVFIPNLKEPSINIVEISSGSTTGFDSIIKGEVHGDFSVKQNSILFIAREKLNEYFHCYEFNLNSEEIRQLTKGDFNVSFCRYSVERNMFFFNKNENGAHKLYCSNPLVNSILHELPYKRNGFEIDLELKNDLYVTNKSHNLPPRLLQVDLQQPLKRNEYAYYDDSNLQLDKPDYLEIVKENSNDKVPAYFWKAKNSEIGNKTIVYVHGGPYHQSTPLWNVRTKILTSSGFNVLTINYHGSSGYSRKFSNNNDETNQVDDILAGIKMIDKLYNIKPENIILMGFSYGGRLILKASNYLGEIGGLVLISGIVDENLFSSNQNGKRILGFYGSLDPLSWKAYNYFKTNGLLDTDFKNLKSFKDEGHILHKSDSWIYIYTTIINTFLTSQE